MLSHKNPVTPPPTSAIIPIIVSIKPKAVALLSIRERELAMTLCPTFVMASAIPPYRIKHSAKDSVVFAVAKPRSVSPKNMYLATRTTLLSILSAKLQGGLLLAHKKHTKLWVLKKYRYGLALVVHES